MSLIISRKTYILLKFIIWLSYFIYSIIALSTIKNYDLKIGVILCGFLIQLTIITFLNNWYKLKTPNLLDWFRLATFFSLILNFLIINFSLDSENFVLVNNLITVSPKEALITLYVILIGLLSLRLGELITKLFFYKKTMFKEKIYQLKNINLLYFSSVLIIILQFYLIFAGTLGYGSDISSNISDFSFLIQIIH